jgi:hypothetical protein
MLKALGWMIKLTLFSIAILLAGDWISWQGRTLSQHLRGHVEQIGRTDTASYVRGLTRKVTADARAGFEKKTRQKDKARGANATQARQDSQTQESAESREINDQVESQAAAPRTHAIAHVEEPIAPSERQKLRALIRELNSAHN